ncbi:Fe-Mn family superoxide dismutase [Mesorhizobium soli]|uniref:superoxide dismutase n=1 Tax=Pseudaminobacter soli (ex Li et al. 2025) TaxID=1295366 RepID=UPI0024741B10|nr:superoxide dismutase [Mesorhizobium soli]MDH6231757.1 Fe-Mn family superoxide dismutase [Mesorhizobium soli]
MPMLSRRRLVLAASSLVAMAAAPKVVFAQATTPAPASTGPFTVPPLSYPVIALEPHIDAKTMELHHGKHHAAYVTAVNVVAKTHPQIATTPIETVLSNLSSLDETIRATIRNNLGGHANHSMFWQIMGPNGGKPEGEVLAAIERDLGGMEKFQNDFNTAGTRQFGSGWVFVTVTKEGKLAIEARPNQDTPLMDGKRVLMGNDVWEHAYYLNYQNRRADYLKAWWNAVNWKRVSERFAAAKAGTLGI